MSILKLEPGDRVHFTVARTEEVQGKFGPQIKFVGTTPDDDDAALFLNVDAATRQLGRIGFSLASVVGSTVEIARTEKNGTKYTDINRASGSVPAPRVTTATVTHASATKVGYSSGPHVPGLDAPRPIVTPEYGDEPAHHAAIEAIKANKLDALIALYRTCFNEAVSVAKLVPTTTPVTHEGISAMAATIFIAAKDRAA